MHPVIQKLQGQLIVSCQALPDEPLYRPEGGIMVLMAKAALQAGAAGIRAQGVTDIQEIKAAYPEVPVIGIIKIDYPGYDSYITPTMKEVDALVATGCEIIALDATNQDRADGTSLADYFHQIKEKYPDQLLMADISTLEEGQEAASLGFDLVGTTMNGYTPQSQADTHLNLDLMRDLVETTQVPIVAEGKIHSPEDLSQALATGVHTAVVGGAITRPQQITASFVQVLE